MEWNGHGLLPSFSICPADDGGWRYVNAILTTPDEKGISTKSGSLVGGAKGKREREQHKGGKVQEVIQGGACSQYML